MDSRRDVIVKEGEKLPHVGDPVECTFCKKTFNLPSDGLCPDCRRPLLIRETSVPRRVEIVRKRDDASPTEVLERSKKILQMRRKAENEKPLTIGDLSLPSRMRNSPGQNRQRMRALEANMAIGDMSYTTAQKDSLEEELARERAEHMGMSVPDLYVGRRFIPQPHTSLSQQVRDVLIQQHQEKVRRRLQVNEYIFNERVDREERNRRAHEEIDRKLAEIREKRQDDLKEARSKRRPHQG